MVLLSIRLSEHSVKLLNDHTEQFRITVWIRPVVVSHLLEEVSFLICNPHCFHFVFHFPLFLLRQRKGNTLFCTLQVFTTLFCSSRTDFSFKGNVVF